MGGIDQYVYQAALCCEDCAVDVFRKDHANVFGGKAKAFSRARILKIMARQQHDSDSLPCGPYSDQESDSPDHCYYGENCLNRENWGTEEEPFWVGQFFENPLTSEGEEYVRQMHRDRASEVTQRWMSFYELEPDQAEVQTGDTIAGV